MWRLAPVLLFLPFLRPLRDAAADTRKVKEGMDRLWRKELRLWRKQMGKGAKEMEETAFLP